MIYVLLFFAELVLLFFLSRIVTRGISYLLYRITGSQKIMVTVMAFFFFPGTLIHELAHYITARLLFVPAGKMEFVPKVIGSGVKMGSVAIGQTDPLRRSLIGMAPFFWGTAIILGILYAFQSFGGIENIWITLLTGYVLFEISNTMFSSKKDMEGTRELMLALIAVILLFYFLGFRFPAVDPETILTDDIIGLFRTGSIFLAVPLVIDIMLIGVLKVLRSMHH